MLQTPTREDKSGTQNLKNSYRHSDKFFLPNNIRAHTIHARIRAANTPHKQRIMQIKIKKQQKSLEMSKKIRIFAADYCEYTNRLWQNDHQNPAMRVKTNL